MSDLTQVRTRAGTSRTTFREAAHETFALVAILVLGSPPRHGVVDPPRETSTVAAPATDPVAARRAAIHGLASRHRALAPAELERVVDSILAEAAAEEVDPLLVAAIVARESGFRTDAVSSRGAVGLMQVRPFVAKDVARRRDLPWGGVESLHLPESNLRFGILYYRELEDRFDGDRGLALAAYHRGPTRLSRQLRTGSRIRSRYADEVLAIYRELDAG